MITGPLTEEDLRDWEENAARRRAVRRSRRHRLGVRLARLALWCLMVACLAHGGPWAWATLAVAFALNVLAGYARPR